MFLANGNKKAKFKWGSLDKAGTIDVNWDEALKNLNVRGVKGFDLQTVVQSERQGAEKFADATGRQLIYRDTGNKFYDRTGKLIAEKDIQEDAFIVAK